MHFDAVVIGAGPAGATCARLLAQAGWRIALVEKAGFPRRKVCGEFLSATSLPVLQACGIAESYLASAGPMVTRVGVFAGDAAIVSPTEWAWGRALGRDKLDMLLRDAAVQAGAALFQPAEIVAHSAEGDAHVCRLADGREISSRVVVAACGSWNAREPFAVRYASRPSDMFAFKALFRNARLADGLMPLLASPGGYGGMVASNDGLTSLSCCVRRDVLALARARYGGKAGDAVLAHIRATTLHVEQALSGVAPDGTVMSVGPIHPGIRPRLEAGIYAVGNLAGEAHPVIAEGISMAIQGAQLLTQCLVAGRPEDYPVLWRRRFATRIRAAGLFAHLAMNGITRSMSRNVIAAFPRILDWGARLSGKA